MPSPALVRIPLLGSATLFVVAWWQRDALPSPDRIDPALLAEPVQNPTAAPEFRTPVGGVTHTVRPLFTGGEWRVATGALGGGGRARRRRHCVDLGAVQHGGLNRASFVPIGVSGRAPPAQARSR